MFSCRATHKKRGAGTTAAAMKAAAKNQSNKVRY